jgi:nucleotide-binding universal stress UspA family protein
MSVMVPAAVTFAHVLVPTDFSEVSERALKYAKTIARQDNSELLLVHLDPPLNLITPPEAAWIDDVSIEAQHAEQLAQSGAALVSDGYRAKAISLGGPLHHELLSAIRQYQIDLIVLGTHGGKGMDRLLAGSDAESTLRHAHCPVLSVGPAVSDRQSQPWNIREVICATTFEPRSAEIAAYAYKFAIRFGAELVFFHVKTPGQRQDHVDWVSFGKAFRHYVGDDHAEYSSLPTRLASAASGSSIVDLARQRGSDLIVMGARPAWSMATHLAPGSAIKVLMEAPCPVMTLLQP